METFSCRCGLNYGPNTLRYKGLASDKQLNRIKISFSRCKDLPLYCLFANTATLFKVEEHAYLPEIKIKYLIVVN